MEHVTLEKIVKYILILLAFFLVLLYSGPAYGKLKTAIFGEEKVNVPSQPIQASQYNKEKPFIPEIPVKTPFYDQFIQDYKECKLSKDVECYCPFRNTLIPDNFVLEVNSLGEFKETQFTLSANTEVKSVGFLDTKKEWGKYYLTTKEGEKLLESSKHISIPNDLLYIETYGKASSKLYIPIPFYDYGISAQAGFNQVKEGKLDEKYFTPADHLYLQGSTIYSDVNIASRDKRDFKNFIIYRKNNEKTFLTQSDNGLTRCSTNPDLVPAFDKFDNLVSSLLKCSAAQNVLPDQACASYEQKIPKDYEIKLDNKKVNLYYKGELLKSSEMFNFDCLLNSPLNPSRKNSASLLDLKFNDYSRVDFYVYEDKAICLSVYELPKALNTKINK